MFAFHCGGITFAGFPDATQELLIDRLTNCTITPINGECWCWPALSHSRPRLVQAHQLCGGRAGDADCATLGLQLMCEVRARLCTGPRKAGGALWRAFVTAPTASSPAMVRWASGRHQSCQTCKALAIDVLRSDAAAQVHGALLGRAPAELVACDARWLVEGGQQVLC